MGFRTKLNGKNGYLTAGHCYNGFYVIESGVFKVIQFANNQNYDYAFVETHSNYTPTNTLAHPGNGITTLTFTPNTCPTFVVGTAIAKSGITTKYTTGKVTALNATVKYSNVNVTITGLVKSNVKADEGDSGGVVLIPGSGSTGVAIGIVSGGSPGFLGIGTTMYFSDIGRLPIAFLNGRY